jgi:anaerobic magnesium-protoporphyrin IX monomethyl ester cyclase
MSNGPRDIAGLWTWHLVGFSTITSNFCDAYDVCEKVKRLKAPIKTVFGGVHASWGKDSLLQKYGEIDFIIAGEGEYSFCKLASGESMFFDRRPVFPKWRVN